MHQQSEESGAQDPQLLSHPNGRSRSTSEPFICHFIPSAISLSLPPHCCSFLYSPVPVPVPTVVVVIVVVVVAVVQKEEMTEHGDALFREFNTCMLRILDDVLDGLGTGLYWSKCPKYACNCGVEKVWRVLRMLPKQEIIELVETQNKVRSIGAFMHSFIHEFMPRRSTSSASSAVHSTSLRRKKLRKNS
jgi:hypothetical protein